MTLLKLDLDGGATVRGVLQRITHWARLTRLRVQAVRYSRSRHGWHVMVQVWQRLSPAEIVAAQAMLGSDWRREAFNLLRVRALGRAPRFWRQPGRWNVFFSGKLQRRKHG